MSQELPGTRGERSGLCFPEATLQGGDGAPEVGRAGQPPGRFALQGACRRAFVLVLIFWASHVFAETPLQERMCPHWCPHPGRRVQEQAHPAPRAGRNGLRLCPGATQSPISLRPDGPLLAQAPGAAYNRLVLRFTPVLPYRGDHGVPGAQTWGQ